MIKATPHNPPLTHADIKVVKLWKTDSNKDWDADD